MKKIVLSAVTLSLLLTAFAAPKRYTLVTNATSWNVSTNWSPLGIPADGDSVTIPENKNLTLSSDLTYSDLYIDIYGALVLSGSNMKILLKSVSTVKVHTSGTLSGSKASQQLVLGTTIIFKGDQSALTGPVMATSTSFGFVPFIENTILPVKFISFTVVHNMNGYLVHWTAEEDNATATYQVQRSNNGTSWTTVATLKAIGNSTNTYSFTDKSAATNTIYYRIKQADADGSITYTTVRTLKNGETTPAITTLQNKIAVVFAQPLKGNVTMEVIGLNGSIAAKQVVSNPTGILQLPTVGLRGIYIVRVSNSLGLNLAKQILL